MTTMNTYADPAPQERTIEGDLFNELRDEVVNPDEIVTEAPAQQFRLGYLDVVCLVLNRVIGEWELLELRWGSRRLALTIYRDGHLQ